jgi:hypothetical protein
MFVIKSLHFRPDEEANASWVSVDDLGFSVVRLMQLSGRKATGVRADLKIQDQDALNTLARHYTENTRLEWRFEIGGGGGAFAVVLRWTKFDRLTGNLQVIRTAVLRDLISEVKDEKSTETRSEGTPSTPEPDGASPGAEDKDPGPQPAPAAEPPNRSESDGRPLVQSVADLWPKLMGTDGRLKASSSNRD